MNIHDAVRSTTVPKQTIIINKKRENENEGGVERSFCFRCSGGSVYPLGGHRESMLVLARVTVVAGISSFRGETVVMADF